MADQKLYFATDDQISKLREMTQAFIEGDQDPNDFLEDLKQTMPIDRTRQDETLKARVEGFFIVSDVLFDRALDEGVAQLGENWTRQSVIKAAKLRPFSYYHWKTGSREPADNVVSRKDYLNDAMTAIEKLNDDIVGLGALIREQRNNPAPDEAKG